MPVFLLGDALAFPDPRFAEPEGLLAVGGDLSPERVLLAYRSGIFPWPVSRRPLLWFSPDPRMILLPEEVHVSRRLAKAMRQGRFEVRVDTAFPDVIRACARAERSGQSGTWITARMIRAYEELHALGYVHSVECWRDDALVGGLYGLSLGAVFCGESMFHVAADASKVAFVTLARQLVRWGFAFVDCQVYTDHLASLGAREEPRERFLARLSEALLAPTRVGRWTFDGEAGPPVTRR